MVGEWNRDFMEPRLKLITEWPKQILITSAQKKKKKTKNTHTFFKQYWLFQIDILLLQMYIIKHSLKLK